MKIFGLSFKYHSIFITLLVLMLLTGILGGWPAAARAASFMVDSANEGATADDANPGDGFCATSLGECTLRAAIMETNALTGMDTITFASDMTIYLTLGALPDIKDPLIIDASSRWNTTTNQPGIVLNGAGGSYNGLNLDADGCGIYGLEITNFNGSGIYIYSANNIIGSVIDGYSNVITSNSGAGISIVGSGAYDNAVQNNFIGVDTEGNKKGNFYGVYLAEGAYHNTIGGDSQEDGNVIAGNQDGIYIINDATHTNYIGGNLIGGASTTQINGSTVAIPGNTRYGVVINGSDENQIGSATLAANGVYENGLNGVHILGGADLNEIIGNTIMSNGKHGIEIADSADCSISNNAIAQNQEDGVRVSGATALGNKIFANTITQNSGKGIELLNGGNLELAAPVITTADDQSAAGTACASCMVTVHSDNGSQGTYYHGFVSADASGNWSFSGNLFGPNVTALAIDNNDNTSEFSIPQSIGGSTQYDIYLPLLQK